MSNNKFKILLVEDDANISSFVETLLNTNGYQVVKARTCAAGVSAFLSHIPDLVILDLGLPDRDGMEFIRTIRKESVTPIIVLSARTTERDKVSALDLGANDYISKPFGNGELLARVRALVALQVAPAEVGHLVFQHGVRGIEQVMGQLQHVLLLAHGPFVLGGKRAPLLLDVAELRAQAAGGGSQGLHVL